MLRSHKVGTRYFTYLEITHPADRILVVDGAALVTGRMTAKVSVAGTIVHVDNRTGLGVAGSTTCRKTKLQSPRRYRAMLAGDMAVLDELCSDDLIYTHSKADYDDKRSYLHLRFR